MDITFFVYWQRTRGKMGEQTERKRGAGRIKKQVEKKGAAGGDESGSGRG